MMRLKTSKRAIGGKKKEKEEKIVIQPQRDTHQIAPRPVSREELMDLSKGKSKGRHLMRDSICEGSESRKSVVSSRSCKRADPRVPYKGGALASHVM